MNRLSDVAYPARILIVDDERSNRQLLEVMLEPEGFFIQTAASGEEALFLVQQRPPDLMESERLHRSAFYAAPAEAEASNQTAPAQLLERGRAEGLADGLAQGEVRCLRTAVSHVLKARDVSLSDHGRTCLTACADAATLVQWLERAATSASEADVFARRDDA